MIMATRWLLIPQIACGNLNPIVLPAERAPETSDPKQINKNDN